MCASRDILKARTTRVQGRQSQPESLYGRLIKCVEAVLVGSADSWTSYTIWNADVTPSLPLELVLSPKDVRRQPFQTHHPPDSTRGMLQQTKKGIHTYIYKWTLGPHRNRPIPHTTLLHPTTLLQTGKSAQQLPGLG